MRKRLFGRSTEEKLQRKEVFHEMEAQWIADRATLRALAQVHPDWGPKELAEAVGRCLSWTKKWLKRFSLVPADDQDILRSRPRAHYAPYRKAPQAVVQRILEIREQPPENLHRTPGPKAILYYLRRDQALAELGMPLPRSSCTVWRILRRFGCILDVPTRRRRPLELAEPMTNSELDFTDVSSVPSEPLGKKQHGVESFNAVEAGTSTWLFTQVRTDFNAETALLAVIELLSQYGCPKQVTFDRDPRWIGTQQMRTFPSAFVRMLLCLGITPRICPPRRPDNKPLVERLHRTLQEEGLLLQHPQTPEAAQEVSEQFRQHSNQERPHQGKACGNVPPPTAFPILPTLPPLPACIDANGR